MTDLRIQLGYIVKHVVSRGTELDDANLGKVVTLVLQLLVQSSAVYKHSHHLNASPKQALLEKLLVIWRSAIGALRLICGKSESACSVLDHHPDKISFAASLIQIAEHCLRDTDLVELLMDTLVVCGDLTASGSFSEATFFVANGLFATLDTVLTSPVIAYFDPVVLSPISSTNQLLG